MVATVVDNLEWIVSDLGWVVGNLERVVSDLGWVVGNLERVVGGLEGAAAVPLDGNLVGVHCTVSVGRAVEDAGLVVEAFEDGVSRDGDDVCGRVFVLCVLFLHSPCDFY